MKRRTAPIQIWFLSEDLQESAKWLSNKQLAKTISGCMSAMVAARMYFVGIRTPKIYKHLFDKDHKAETMERLFPLWPLKLRPPFGQYKTRASKWCRMCKEHYDYVKQYLDVLLLEYEFRYQKPHGLSKYLEWEELDAPKLNIPSAHVSKVTIPWKCLSPQHRRKDICEGYRAQYKAMLLNDGIKVSDFKNRDIPEFLCDNSSKWMS